MPKRKAPPRPTNAELAILTVLWRRGPSTVRDVHEALRDPVGYTTVLKLLQIMTEKGLVTRDERTRTHVYRAAVSEATTRRHLVSDLVERAFGGSSVALVLQALSNTPASRDELEQIRQLLDQRKGETR
ncbi:MAG TPA: BlaI/MecI/CopY family transcriptional regulator [Gemmatimonadaceae bacterium]|nr:BlaI/MecI/CopY family transcriptional regulator [Gemmatimonadaceae bacterium]